MDRINGIIRNACYQECLQKNRAHEETRIFCRHDMAHFLDVARLAWIENLDRGSGIDRELVYAAALLHDCGRFRQYEDAVPHEQASGELAAGILEACGFTPEEKEEILAAILRHRDKEMAEERGLSGLIYRADKQSRSCFACPAEGECDWSREKKNLLLRR